jgi:hypothetical protein
LDGVRLTWNERHRLRQVKMHPRAGCTRVTRLGGLRGRDDGPRRTAGPNVDHKVLLRKGLSEAQELEVDGNEVRMRGRERLCQLLRGCEEQVRGLIVNLIEHSMRLGNLRPRGQQYRKKQRDRRQGSACERHQAGWAHGARTTPGEHGVYCLAFFTRFSSRDGAASASKRAPGHTLGQRKFGRAPDDSCRSSTPLAAGQPIGYSGDTRRVKLAAQSVSSYMGQPA